jgi:hypothetical protein
MAAKKVLFLITGLLIFQSHARADEILTTIFNVIESDKTERILVLSSKDGRIYKYPKNEKNLKVLKSLVGAVVKLSFITNSKESLITRIEKLDPRDVDVDELDLNYFQHNQLRVFAPTDLQPKEKVENIFNNLLNDGDKGRSQCFKRAHMWAYEMWSNLGIFSQKIFIFYTQRYIQLEDFKWWFHVAPLVTSDGEDLVLDGTFLDKPISVREWKDKFITTTDITCPMVDKYQDYEQNQWNRLCYLMKVPMYYLSPLDIENRDKKGIEKTHWVLEELQDARRAFKNYNKTYEGLDTGKPTINH